MRSALLVAVVLVAAGRAGAEQLATIVHAEFAYHEQVIQTHTDIVHVLHGAIAEREWILPFGTDQIGVEHEMGGDFLPWGYRGDNMYGDPNNEDLWLRLYTLSLNGYGAVLANIRLDDPVGTYVYYHDTSGSATVERLLPLLQSGPTVYTSATWTVDSLDRQPTLGGEWSTNLTITGLYYIVPEPSCFILAVAGIGSLRPSRCRKPTARRRS